MLNRLFTTSFIVTLLSCIPAYFVVAQGLQSSAALPQLIILLLVVSTVSVWLGGRNNQARPKQRKRSSAVILAGTPRESGSVKWFNASKGFGFITRDSGDDIFVHFRSIRGEGHRILRDGQRVEFAVSEGDKGLQAKNVHVV